MTALPRPNHYRVIYADPPWTFSTYSRKGKGRSAEAYYDCMTLPELKALPVAEWAADDCVLLLWTTDPLLPTALEVIRAWGFTYKTVGFYWAKLNKSADPTVYHEASFFTGLGFWTRANPELCLLGDPRPPPPPPGRRAQADRLPAARAQPQAGRGVPADRSLVRGTVSGDVRALLTAGMGAVGRRIRFAPDRRAALAGRQLSRCPTGRRLVGPPPARLHQRLSIRADYRGRQGGCFRDGGMVGWALRWMLLWCGLTVACVAVIRHDKWLPSNSAAAPDFVLSRAGPAEPRVAEPRADPFNTLVYPTNPSGHVVIDAVVNGASMRMLVDTGASFVTLTPADARAAGIAPGDLVFDQRAATANGVVRMAMVTLREVRLGQLSLDDVRAAVIEHLNVSLLGMSFLDRLQSYQMRDGKLTITW